MEKEMPIVPMVNNTMMQVTSLVLNGMACTFLPIRRCQGTRCGRGWPPFFCVFCGSADG